MQELLTRGDPYNIKSDLLDLNVHGYKKYGKKCDSCNNFVDETSFVISKATWRKYWIRRDSTCTPKNVIYLAYCTKCGEQGTGSTVSWKPRLSNYKSHIKQSVHSCKILKYFIEKCNDPIVPFSVGTSSFKLIDPCEQYICSKSVEKATFIKSFFLLELEQVFVCWIYFSSAIMFI